MSGYSTIEGCIRQSTNNPINKNMDLNKLISDVLDKYAESQPNMSSDTFRKKLANEIEVEVDKYCLMLLTSLNN
tara:strand:- start:444 stop:665 length:222 start_codon:yes stop_codon:yes gene_type:complete